MNRYFVSSIVVGSLIISLMSVAAFAGGRSMGMRGTGAPSSTMGTHGSMMGTGSSNSTTGQ